MTLRVIPKHFIKYVERFHRGEAIHWVKCFKVGPTNNFDGAYFKDLDKAEMFQRYLELQR